ncbi:hypothetical protein ACIOHO_37360 [Streptomyces sp. NPDC087849]
MRSGPTNLRLGALVRTHPGQPRVLGFKAATLQQAITAYQAEPSRV